METLNASLVDIRELQRRIHETAKTKGWWDSERNAGECIALMHSELSEALEWLRKGDSEPSDHIPGFLGIEEELADVIIRVLDFAESRGLDIEGAIFAKVAYNINRPHRHGGKRF